jgi:hypothetical protein
MEVSRVFRESSGRGRTRLGAEVVYADRSAEPYWFEVDDAISASLSDSGNPWLLTLLPLAVTLGEPLTVRVPVDPVLLRNAREIQAIWAGWDPELRPVELSAEVNDAGSGSARRTGAFFSAGVDSFFAVLQNDAHPEFGLRADELLSVHGFDVPISRESEFERHRRRAEEVAGKLGKSLVVVRTNLRETRFRELNWGEFAHGCALGGAALAVEPRYDRMVIASSIPYHRMKPWGSHPLTDVLMSTSGLTFFHEGATHDRRDKVQWVAEHELVHHYLHVCWRSQSDENCGRCEKCLRNMCLLELYGQLHRFTVFPTRTLEAREIARVLMPRGRAWNSIYALARAQGRRDLTRAIRRSRRRSLWIHAALSVAEFFKKKRGLWRARHLLRTRVLRGVPR